MNGTHYSCSFGIGSTSPTCCPEPQQTQIVDPNVTDQRERRKSCYRNSVVPESDGEVEFTTATFPYTGEGLQMAIRDAEVLAQEGLGIDYGPGVRVAIRECHQIERDLLMVSPEDVLGQEQESGSIAVSGQ